MCGDSRDKNNVTSLMDGKLADMVFTDPPYGVAIGAKNRMLNSFQKSGRNLTDIKDDAMKPEDLKASLLPAFVNLRSIMSDHCTVFVTAPQGGDLGSSGRPGTAYRLNQRGQASCNISHY